MNEIQLTEVCCEIAGLMVICGAEIYRVEDTAARICHAYGHDEAQIYATPANFIITVKDMYGIPYTESRDIPGRATNLDRVGSLNELSRYICAKKPPVEVIRRKLEEIKSRPVYSAPWIYLSYAIVGAAFTVFFGGTLVEAAYGAILALLVKLIDSRLSRLRSGVFLNSVVCSMAVSFAAVSFMRLGLVPRFDKMIIGAAMTMVPGVQMTNCMRDFILGDFFSGIYTMTEALIVAVGLAVGAGSAVAAVIRF